MNVEGQVGKRYVKEGSENIIRTTTDASVVVQQAHGELHEAVSRGSVFMLSGAALAGTAYVGAGAGTPLLAVHNPTGSGYYFSLVAVGISMRAAATGAGQTGLNVWAGASVLPTGTTTAPRSASSYVASGSSGVGFVNTALTSSTALNLALPLFTYYWATAAGAILSPGLFLCEGLVMAIPGNQIAVGLSVIPTSTTADVAMFWEEIQI